jgi:hypothetical protein
MCQVIDSDAVLAFVLSQRESVDMAFLRKLQTKLCPDFFLDIDSESVSSTVFLHSELFDWKSEGVVCRASDAQNLFASSTYIEASYGASLPEACKQRIVESSRQTT